ncbi:MAG TPA: selenocysteine-specific translation elongation factor [Gemmatimonadota bacterium]|nr:selenocysteine-specific translation elongation factor [Gemmatimonadota bacterium]
MSDSSPTDVGADHRVVGTAGHIDHGKTALVAALTGVDTDRLPEERRRGISIDLGFAPLDLGAGAPLASVVDVPGHEGFVKNMVAGASGIDAVLFVVAADEGMMPQSREHLLVLEALGVERGAIAITKIDLVDPEWVALVVESVREELRDSVLADAPIVPVSSRTGAGIEALRQALAGTVAELATETADFPFRMPVDRTFGIPGAGTVVTGTVWSGELAEGGFVVGLPQDERARVRSIEVHGEAVHAVRHGRRAALGLASGGQSFERGTVLVSPEAGWRPWTRVEVAAWIAARAPRPVRSRDRLRIHHGTSETMGRLRWHGEREVAPGGEGYALLELESPIVPAVGDRIVLRAYSPMTTMGGARVLALGGRRLRGAARSERARRLAAVDSAAGPDRVLRALELAGSEGLDSAALPIATGLGARAIAAAAEAADPRVERIGDRWFDRGARERAMARVLAALEAFHAREPLQPGMPLEAARQAARAPAPLAESAIRELERTGAVERRGAALAIGGHSIELGGTDHRLVEQALERYGEAGLEPPETEALAADLRVDVGRLRRLLEHLERQGRLVKLAGDWFVDAAAMATAERMLVERLGREEGGADTGAFKEMFGVTRKYLIPILEYFDRRGLTRRDGNRRVLAERA